MTRVAPFVEDFKSVSMEGWRHPRTADLTQQQRYIGAEFDEGNKLIHAFFCEREGEGTPGANGLIEFPYGHMKKLTPDILKEHIAKLDMLRGKAVSLQLALDLGHLWSEDLDYPEPEKEK